MKHLQLFSKKHRDSLLNKRKGETKFGERLTLLGNITNIYDALKDLDVEYVIFGISESIGVFANHGKSGTEDTWEATIKFLLNIQNNDFIQSNKVVVLGHLDYDGQLETIKNTHKSEKKQVQSARQFVEEIDKDVSHIVYSIIKAGKTPIIIGGGHNNAYGNLKGSALALNQQISAINFDAHTDFRTEEGRHSGNGFSYAYAEGFLNRYMVFGLHENYTSKNIFKKLDKLQCADYISYEAISIRKDISFNKALNRSEKFMGKDYFGIELDCDTMQNVPSSAMTPNGFTTKQARRFVHHFGMQKKAVYLHICEAIPTGAYNVGKLITYLVTDFIKAKQHANR
ncbi:formimidoylglutamase [Winogradskyella maritima]|uniref:Formimidoylglutamase n=1 Tax=Winogradskyella maritima TaxID=1517766 RepID=A0ABV8ALL5_9FLAO|nr:formimidoylglutamase [Winogradskyella maritima]